MPHTDHLFETMFNPFLSLTAPLCVVYYTIYHARFAEACELQFPPIPLDRYRVGWFRATAPVQANPDVCIDVHRLAGPTGIVKDMLRIPSLGPRLHQRTTSNWGETSQRRAWSLNLVPPQSDLPLANTYIRPYNPNTAGYRLSTRYPTKDQPHRLSEKTCLGRTNWHHVGLTCVTWISQSRIHLDKHAYGNFNR